MNKIYAGINLLTTEDEIVSLINETSDISGLTIENYDFESLKNKDLCDCHGNGIFSVFARHSEIVSSSGVRYMQCLVCGKYSSL